MVKTYATLESYRTGGYGLWASCAAGPSCTHFADLDLDRLIDRFGPDFDVIDRKSELLARLRCRRCGSDQVELRIAAPTRQG